MGSRLLLFALVSGDFVLADFSHCQIVLGIFRIPMRVTFVAEQELPAPGRGTALKADKQVSKIFQLHQKENPKNLLFFVTNPAAQTYS